VDTLTPSLRFGGAVLYARSGWLGARVGRFAALTATVVVAAAAVLGLAAGTAPQLDAAWAVSLGRPSVSWLRRTQQGNLRLYVLYILLALLALLLWS